MRTVTPVTQLRKTDEASAGTGGHGRSQTPPARRLLCPEEEVTAKERTEARAWRRNRGCGCGGGGFFFVLTVGIVLSLLNLGVGAGVSVRIPFTSSNITVAGAVGAKGKTVHSLPDYTEGRLGGNQNFFNNSTTLTIGPAEGAVLVIIGKQDGAPVVDLHLVAH